MNEVTELLTKICTQRSVLSIQKKNHQKDRELIGHSREGSKGSVSYAFSAYLLTIMMVILLSERVPQRDS